MGDPIGTISRHHSAVHQRCHSVPGQFSIRSAVSTVSTYSLRASLRCVTLWNSRTAISAPDRQWQVISVDHQRVLSLLWMVRLHIADLEYKQIWPRNWLVTNSSRMLTNNTIRQDLFNLTIGKLWREALQPLSCNYLETLQLQIHLSVHITATVSTIAIDSIN